MSDEEHDDPSAPVEVIRVHTPKEAAEITEMLHRAGIPAMPDVARTPYRVLVPRDWVDVAEAVVDAIFMRPEGDATQAEIEELLAEHQAARGASNDPLPRHGLSPITLLLLLILAAIAWLTLGGW